MAKIFNRRNTKQFRQNLKQSMTKSEVIFWSQIKNDSFGYRFRRQHGIGPYIVDFYCPKLKLAIEIDGSTHYEESVFKKDVIKQKYLESIGITVRRYNSEQVFNDLDNVLKDLENTCNLLATSATPPDPLLERGG